MTVTMAKKLESEIASLRSEVAELRARITIVAPDNEDTELVNDMTLWNRASASDFNTFSIKHKT